MKKITVLRASSDFPANTLENLERLINKHLEKGAELISAPVLLPYTDDRADFPSRFVAYATIQYETNDSDSIVNIF